MFDISNPGGVLVSTAGSPPTISNLNPASSLVGANAFSLTITGTNFVSGSQVVFNGTNLGTGYVGPTSLQVTVPASQVYVSGNTTVNVSVTTPGVGSSGNLTFTINNTTPTLSSINPSTDPQNTAGPITVTLTGGNFNTGCIGRWNGSNRTTIPINGTSATMQVTNADLQSAPGTYPVSVNNPGTGGGTSSGINFVITSSTVNPILTAGVLEWGNLPTHVSSVFQSPQVVPGDPTAVIYAWSSGWYDSDRSYYYIWGGGHVDYSGNEVYRLGPLNGATSPTWQRITDPSNPPANNTSYGSDGRPVARHTYDLLDYLPSPYNKMMSAQIGSQYSNGFSEPAVDFFDCTYTGSGEPWSHSSNVPAGGLTGQSSLFRYNTATNLGWFVPNEHSSSPLCKYNPATDTWTSYGSNNMPGYYHTTAIDTVRNFMLAIRSDGVVIVWNLNSPSNAYFTLSTSGSPNPMSAQAPGFIYDPVNDRFVAWAGGSTLYALSIPTSGNYTGTATWTTITLASDNSVTPTAQATDGTFGRFRYCPDLHMVVVVNDTSQDVYYCKLEYTELTMTLETH